MTDVRKGDTVRVVLEGVVTATTPTSFDLGALGNHANVIFESTDHVQSVQVLKRAQVRTGDLIEGRREYDDLPDGAIVRGNQYDGGNIVKVPGGFVYSDNGRFRKLGSFSDERTVLYAPES
jgi:hypothetical protein